MPETAHEGVLAEPATRTCDSESSDSPACRPASRRPFRSALPLCLTLAIGVVVAAWPHIAHWRATGDLAWFLDPDDLLYNAYLARAYHEHPWRVSDPVQADGGATIYPWLQFIPFVLTARALGLPSLQIDLVMRIFAGASMAAALYLLCRQATGSRWLAAAIAIVCLTDAGFSHGEPLFAHAQYGWNVLQAKRAGVAIPEQLLLPQWRLITPAVSLWALLLHVYLVNRSFARKTLRSTLLAGASFGLLFYVYLYYWTAAGLALALGALLDPKRRTGYFLTGSIGVLIGAPSVVGGYLLKSSYSPDWLHRADSFLPIPRFSELLVPKFAIVGILAAIMLGLLRRQRPDYVVWVAVAGLLLLNHQVVSGLQIQNFHFNYVWGPFLYLALVLEAFRWLPRLSARAPRVVAPAIAVAVGCFVIVGVWFQTVVATELPQAVRVNASVERFQAQLRDNAASPMIPLRAAAGDPEFIDQAIIQSQARPLVGYTVMLSPSVDDEEFNRRSAINALLLGKPLGALVEAISVRRGWGAERRFPAARERRAASLARHYESLESPDSLDGSLAEFDVQYIGLSVDAAPPEVLSRTTWKQIHHGPYWNVWERVSNLATHGARHASDP